jgi:hypothetical protein
MFLICFSDDRSSLDSFSDEEKADDRSSLDFLSDEEKGI